MTGGCNPGEGTAYSRHMKDAFFMIQTPGLLAKVADLLDRVPMEDRDTKGNVYEYMLAKATTAGQNGQFRTPRHSIEMTVELTAPKPTGITADHACGTAGFLVAAGEYLREHHPEVLTDEKLRKPFNTTMFHGFDFDSTMLRMGSMNMLLRGVENLEIQYRDSLTNDHAVVMRRRPFRAEAETCDADGCAFLMGYGRKTQTDAHFTGAWCVHNRPALGTLTSDRPPQTTMTTTTVKRTPALPPYACG